MAKKKQKKQKVRTIIKRVEAKVVDQTPKLKKEIEELQIKKKSSPKGFKGFIQKAQINKAINTKRQYIQAKEGARNLGEATKNIQARIEFEKKRGELQELREKNQVNFGGFGFGSGPKKELKFEDLF